MSKGLRPREDVKPMIIFILSGSSLLCLYNDILIFLVTLWRTNIDALNIYQVLPCCFKKALCTLATFMSGILGLMLSMC